MTSLKKSKGQITQDFTLALVIMLIFITLVLTAESEVLPKIWEKQLAESERIKNIYKCSVIDTAAAFKTQGISFNSTNGTCLSKTDDPIGREEYRQFEPYKERG